MIKLLLVDDHKIVRDGLRCLLAEETHFKIVGEAQTGEEAVTLARALSPDVVLMDIHMPGIGGLEATLKLQRLSPAIKTIILTACDDLFFLEHLLQAGASGYLTKAAPLQELIRAIRLVHAGQCYIAPELASQLAIKHILQESKAPFASLSGRELQIALMVAKGIKTAVIGEQLCLSPKTVNGYRYRIFAKLPVSNDVELTRYAVQQGLLEENSQSHAG